MAPAAFDTKADLRLDLRLNFVRSIKDHSNKACYHRTRS